MEECNCEIEQLQQQLTEVKMDVDAATRNLDVGKQKQRVLEFRLKQKKLKLHEIQFSEIYRNCSDHEFLKLFTEKELTVLKEVAPDDLILFMNKINEIKERHPTWELFAINKLKDPPPINFSIMWYLFTFEAMQDNNEDSGVLFTCQFFSHFKIVDICKKKDT